MEIFVKTISISSELMLRFQFMDSAGQLAGKNAMVTLDTTFVDIWCKQLFLKKINNLFDRNFIASIVPSNDT